MNIAIVEDHRLLAETLKGALINQKNIREVQIFPHGEAFLNKNNSWQPQLLISDILMPGKSGMELIKAYRELAGEDLKVIIMSSLSSVPTLKQALKLGANGYLNKEEPLEELITAIETVTAGEQYISKSLRKKLMNNLLGEDDSTTGFHLSPREGEVLTLVCSGLLIKEIAAKLNLSTNTVLGYHKNIMYKFNVKRTPELIIAAIKYGFYNVMNKE